MGDQLASVAVAEARRILTETERPDLMARYQTAHTAQWRDGAFEPLVESLAAVLPVLEELEAEAGR